MAAHIGNSLEDLDYIERNPAFEVHSTDCIDDGRAIGAHDDIVAMNGVLMVDLTEQIGVYSFGAQVGAFPCEARSLRHGVALDRSRREGVDDRAALRQGPDRFDSPRARGHYRR